MAETEFENDIWNTNPTACPQKETPETGREQDLPLWLNAGVDHLTLCVLAPDKEAGVFPRHR